jgi:hypothetical protein
LRKLYTNAGSDADKDNAMLANVTHILIAQKALQILKVKDDKDIVKT